MADMGVSAGGGASLGGIGLGASAGAASAAGQASFEQASGAKGRAESQAPADTKSDTAPPDKPSYRQQMEGLRNERKELQAKRDMLQDGVANKHSVLEMQKEVQRVMPQLAEIDQEIARNEKEQTALAQGMEPNVTHEEGETCEITVQTKPAIMEGLPGNHSYVKMIDHDGEHYVRGGPERAVQTPENGGVWGRDYTQTGKYVPGTMDWSTEPRDTATVAELEGDCSPHFEKMKETTQAIDEADHTYRAIFAPQNCNSVTHTVLKHSGFDTPDMPGWEPGNDNDLLEGEQATADRLPADAMP